MTKFKLRSRRPSPSLVISILALFVALGGSAYAASKVGTKDIKKNAVTAIKIKKNAVTTAKIKGNAVTGAKVDEGTLAPVPNALHADNATNADNAVNAANFKRFGTTGLVTRSHNQDEVISVADGPGPFSFGGLCVDIDGKGAYSIYATIRSSQAGSFVFSEGGVADFSDGKIPANADIPISPLVTSGGPSWGKGMGEFTATTADGSLMLRGFVNVGTHVFGGECAFNISWIEVQ